MINDLRLPPAPAAALRPAPLACRLLLALDAAVILVPSSIGLPALVAYEAGIVIGNAFRLGFDPRATLALALGLLMLLDLIGLWTMMAQAICAPATEHRAARDDRSEDWSHLGALIALVLCLFPQLDPMTFAPPLLVPYLHLQLHRYGNARRLAETVAPGATPPMQRRSEAPRADAHATPDFERLVGRAGWMRLRGRIRERFTAKPGPGRDIHYRGVMEKVECSAPGWVLAQLCRLIGTPFALHRGRNVPTAIRLEDDGNGGVIWHREYAFAGRAPVHVQSTKRGGPDDSLLECVGMGLGMRLAVFEANGDLHFLSVRYFLRLGGRYLHLPHWLSPGTAHVIHRDLAGRRFRFTMTIHHAWFGTLFHQDGVFEEQGHACGAVS